LILQPSIGKTTTMNAHYETIETWNQLAFLYQEKFMDFDLYNETYDFICHSISKNNAKLLEIGCGPGNITKYLLEKRPDFLIFGIDSGPNMIELARKNNPTARFQTMDCRKIGGIADLYDGIVCGFCIPYLSIIDCKQLVENANKLLEAEGLFYLSFVEGDPVKSDFQVSSRGDRIFFHYHELDEISRLLTVCNFETVQVFHVDYVQSEGDKEMHTLLVARKKSSSEFGIL
jgi:2-polyprenyl-3-methyl-5-hydroxy-6-metoxy-1,4-benzoquinol methylase